MDDAEEEERECVGSERDPRQLYTPAEHSLESTSTRTRTTEERTHRRLRVDEDLRLQPLFRVYLHDVDVECQARSKETEKELNGLSKPSRTRNTRCE